jgi:hypothetical protein
MRAQDLHLSLVIIKYALNLLLGTTHVKIMWKGKKEIKFLTITTNHLYKIQLRY